MYPDFLIIGGGVLGATSALALARVGARVSLVEQGSLGRESSWAGGGILFPLLPWDYADAVNALVRRSLSLYPSLAESLRDATGVDPEYQRCGMLVLPPFDASTAQAWCATHATAAEILAARAIVPELALDEEALWLPEVAQARNPRLLKALRRRLESLGVRFFEQTEATGWQTDGARVSGVTTPNGLLRAGSYVVAAGAWSRRLLAEHASGVDIRPIRGQMLLFKAEPGALQTIILKNGIYLIPRLDGHVLVGSTLEDVGFDKSTTEEARATLHAQATGILPWLEHVPLIQHWSGLRPGSPDNIPVIARHPHLENLYLNSGHFRYGVTMAPASAEIMANLILDRAQKVDIAPYRWPGKPC